MQIIKGKKKIRGVIYLLLCLLTVFVCWLFVGRNGGNETFYQSRRAGDTFVPGQAILPFYQQNI